MDFARHYDEFGGKRGVPPGMEECLMWSAGWAMGVLMVKEEHGIELRGANPGQGARTGIEEHLTSTAAHPC